MKVVNTEDGVETTGLVPKTGFELRLPLLDAGLANSAAKVLKTVATYFAEGPPLHPGETMDWGSSLLVSKPISPACISFGEMDYDGETVLPCVDRAIRIWDAQSIMCHSENVGRPFDLPGGLGL